MIPWDAISFAILWLQYIGFSKSISGLVMILAAIGAACGAIFGGWLGDRASRTSPNRGRLTMAQVSIFLSIPMSIVYIYVIPKVFFAP
jgi:MFS family permease